MPRHVRNLLSVGSRIRGYAGQGRRRAGVHGEMHTQGCSEAHRQNPLFIRIGDRLEPFCSDADWAGARWHR